MVRVRYTVDECLERRKEGAKKAFIEGRVSKKWLDSMIQ